MENTYTEKQAKKKISKYIWGSKGVYRFFCIILAAVTLFGLLQITVFRKHDDRENAPQFDAISTETGEFCYLDVIGMSDWIYKVTSRSSVTFYYVCMDENEYLYVLKLSADEYKNLAKQREWWTSEEGTPAPEPYRLYGVSSYMSSEIKDAISSYYDLNSSEFDRTFGEKMFSGGTSGAEGSNAVWTFFALGFGVLWLILAFLERKLTRQAKKALKALEKRGELVRAAEEMESESSVSFKRGMKKLAILSDNYVFGRNSGQVMRYEDILWAYVRTVYNRGVTSSSMIVNTADSKKINLCALGVGNVSEAAGSIFAVLKQHNPDILLGMTKENRKMYKELAKQKKLESK